MNDTDDLRLLRSFARGDHAALGSLAARYERPLLGLAYGLLNARADLAADAVQDTWLRVVRSARDFSGRSSVKTWLYRILINRCHDLRQKHPPLSLNGTVHEQADHASPAAVGEMERREGLESLRRHVEALRPDHRTLILLCYHAGLTHEQAADVLDLPVGTLKSRLHAALTDLRGRLAEVNQP